MENRYGISVRFISATKLLYRRVTCAVDVNSSLSSWFNVDSGVKQGVYFPPLYLLCSFHDLNSQGVGVAFNGSMLSALLYADDTVIMAP